MPWRLPHCWQRWCALEAAPLEAEVAHVGLAAHRPVCSKSNGKLHGRAVSAPTLASKAECKKLDGIPFEGKEKLWKGIQESLEQARLAFCKCKIEIVGKAYQ